MPKIKLEGMEKLQVKLKKNVQMSDLKRVVRKNGSELQYRDTWICGWNIKA